MMANLRREVEGKSAEDGGRATPGSKEQRRFQPPRRRQVASSTPSKCSTPSKGPPVPPAVPRSGTPQSAQPSEEVYTNRPQSVEIAWLMRTSQRMDEEASEVVDFLSRNGLRECSSKLVNAPSGVGSSMASLHEADEELLAEAGMTSSEQQLLQAALQNECQSHTAAEDAGRCESRSAASDTEGRATPSQAGKQQALQKLRAPPPGWSCVATPPQKQSQSEKIRKVILVDSGVGGEDPIPEEDEEPCGHGEVMSAALSEGVGSATPEMVHALPPLRPEVGDGLLMKQPAVFLGADSVATPATTRPPTASSQATVQTTSTGARRPAGDNKVCCYECFRQVHAQHAVSLDNDGGAVTSQRHFCSEACASRFQKACAQRSQRAQELSQLRAQVLAGQEQE